MLIVFFICMILIAHYPIIGAILVSLFFLFMVCKLIKQIWTDNYPGANKKGIKYKIINTLLFFLLVALIIMCSYHSGESGYNYSDYFIDRIP